MAIGSHRMTILYESRQLWIRKLVSKFHGRFGGDWDELHAEALFWFVIAVRSWQPRKGALNKHISFRIWTGMLEFRRKRAKLLRPNLDDVSPEQLSYSTTWFADFLDELSWDGRVIVQAVLQPDFKLERRIDNREGLLVVRRALREYLSDWDPDRVTEAFNDIEAAIKPRWSQRMIMRRWLDSRQTIR